MLYLGKMQTCSEVYYGLCMQISVLKSNISTPNQRDTDHYFTNFAGIDRM